MPKVFLAYKTVDADRAAAVRAKLEALGVPLFIDQKLKAGDNYISAINDELSSAVAVLVLWTEAAVHVPAEGEPPNFVLSEAQRGYSRGILVAAAFEKMALDHLPVPFNLFQAPDISNWIQTGASAKHQEWQKVLSALGKKLNRPGLADLAVVLEANDDVLKRKFLKEYPQDPLAPRIADELEAVERNEFEASLSEARKRIDKRTKDAQKRLKLCADQFEKQIAELRAGHNFMPPKPLDALDDNVGALQNQIEIYEGTIRDERARADKAVAEVAALKDRLGKAVTDTAAADVKAANRAVIVWSSVAAVAAAIVFGFAGSYLSAGPANLSAAGKQLKDMQAALDAANSKNASLQEQAGNAQAAADAASAKNKSMQAQLQTAQAQAGDATKSQELLKIAQTRIDEASAKIQSLEGQLKTTQAVADQAAAKNQTLQAGLGAIQAANGAIPLDAQCDALAGYQFDPDRPANNGYADALADIAKAQMICQNALQANSGDPKTLRRMLSALGRLSESNGDLQAAAQNWQKAAGLGSSQAYFQLATYYANRKNPQYNLAAAWNNLKKSADSDPANPMALFRLAYTLLFPSDSDNPFNGLPADLTAGERYLQRALSSDYGPAFYSAGVHYWRTDPVKAKSYLVISGCIKHYIDPPYDAPSYYAKQTGQQLSCQ